LQQQLVQRPRQESAAAAAAVILAVQQLSETGKQWQPQGQVMQGAGHLLEHGRQQAAAAANAAAGSGTAGAAREIPATPMPTGTAAHAGVLADIPAAAALEQHKDE
jgi:hypothetical protein